MDKYEYRIKADAIKSLIAEGDYKSAMEIADEIDWRRVKSVMMLCTISDLYKINRRLEDSRDLLLLAYGRHPGGRTIVFSLCELSIKMGDILLAVEYYKEFVQIAPNDTGRYILQYKLYEAQEVSLEERIAVLEQMKKEDYREKWAFELANLYHKAGMATRCVEECDELILWFGEGKYVVKAMELKMLHQALTPDQQAKYDMFMAPVEEPEPEPVVEKVAQEPEATQVTQPETAIEDEIHVKTMDVGEYNTINLQKEIAEGLKEVLNAPQDAGDAITKSIIAPMLRGTTQIPAKEVQEQLAEPEVESEVFFGETSEMELGSVEAVPWQAGEAPTPLEEAVDDTGEATEEETTTEEIVESEQDGEEPVEEALAEEEPTVDATAKAVMEDMRKARKASEEPPKELANVLSMESDGQIRLVMPKEEAVEKQITGQMSIDDILAEWERMKTENKEKREAEVRQRVLQRTGPMFTEFEAQMRDSLLEQIEADKVKSPAVMKLGDMESEEESGEVAMEAISEEDFTGEIAVKSVEAAIEESQAEEEVSLEEILEEDVLEEEIPVEEIEVEELHLEESDGSDAEVEELEEILEESTSYIEEESPVEEIPEFEEEVVVEEVFETEDEPVIEEIPESEEEAIVEDVPENENEAIAEEEVVVEEAPAEPVVRTLTREEKELFAPYIQGKASKNQLIKVLDGISMAAYTGNVIVTGPEGVNTLGLAKNIVRDVQASDNNFAGKTAKISGGSLDKQDIPKLTRDLANGALIVQKAAEMSDASADSLYKALQQEHLGILVILEDTKKAMNKFLAKHKEFTNVFTARMDVDALSDDALVAFAKKYAWEMEYSIDEFGVLALHQRIDEMQTSDHVVTVLEVKELMDGAIRHANRKNLGHFFDILLGKRYDDEDMIILREKDFV